MVHDPHQLLPDVAELRDQRTHGLRPDVDLGQGAPHDVQGPDQRQEPLVGRHLAVQVG